MLTAKEKETLKNLCKNITQSQDWWKNNNFYEPLWNRITSDMHHCKYTLEELTEFANIDKAEFWGNNIILSKNNIKGRFNTENKTLEIKESDKKYISMNLFIKNILKSGKDDKILKTAYYIGGIINILYFQCQGLYINSFAYDAYRHIK